MDVRNYSDASLSYDRVNLRVYALDLRSKMLQGAFQKLVRVGRFPTCSIFL